MKLFEGLPTEVKALSIVSFFVAVGFGVQAPALPLFANELGAGSTAVGAMIAVFALVRMISAWPVGRSVNIFGERATLVAGMALLAVTSVLAGLSQSAWQLILFRGLGGLGSAGFSISAMSLLLRKSPHDARGRALGLLMGALNMGLVAGPAIGGALAALPPRTIFFLYGAVVAVTGVIAMRVMAHDRAPTIAGRHVAVDAISLVEASRSATFRAAVTANFSLGWIAYGLRASVLPLLLLKVLHEGAHWIGIGLALCALIQVGVLPASGRLTDIWGHKRPLVAGSALLIVSLVLLLVWPTLVSYLLCLSIMGVGTALCATSSSAAVGDVTNGVTIRRAPRMFMS